MTTGKNYHLNRLDREFISINREFFSHNSTREDLKSSCGFIDEALSLQVFECYGFTFFKVIANCIKVNFSKLITEFFILVTLLNNLYSGLSLFIGDDFVLVGFKAEEWEEKL